MNIIKHCQLSVHRWGGVEADYIDIHTFIDQTKSVCPDMRHRFFHTVWAINYLVIPRFGYHFTNSSGKKVDIKDLCERDHLLIDYANKFIPTLGDFVDAIDDVLIPNYRQKLEQFHQKYITDPKISTLMLSPLSHTGKVKSLLLTHNSWFVNEVLPQLFDFKPIIDDFLINPSFLFNAMEFELWMDNGIAFPSSAKMLEKRLVTTRI